MILHQAHIFPDGAFETCGHVERMLLYILPKIISEGHHPGKKIKRTTVLECETDLKMVVADWKLQADDWEDWGLWKLETDFCSL